MHSNSTTATAAQALGKLCGHAKPPFFIGKKGIETLILQGCFRSRGNPGRALITADTGLLVPTRAEERSLRVAGVPVRSTHVHYRCW